MIFLPAWCGRTRNDACGSRAMRYADVEKAHKVSVMPRDSSLTPSAMEAASAVHRASCGSGFGLGSERCGRGLGDCSIVAKDYVAKTPIRLGLSRKA